MKKIMFLFGTRPEAIKLAPLIRLFKAHKDEFETIVCVSGQHRQMLDQVLNFFEIEPDLDLELMEPNQSLFSLSAKMIAKMEKVFTTWNPDLVFVQGDTTTVFMGALAAYFKKVKVAHVEAGLRSFNKYSPFPEEMNRLLTSRLADIHFVPTKISQDNLRREGVSDHVHVTGNTVIDALFLGLELIKKHGESRYAEKFNFLKAGRRLILTTCHRRENFGEGVKNIFGAIKKLAVDFPDIDFLFPVHLNPNIQSVAHSILKDQTNIFLMEPLDYPELIYIMSKSYFILTDSGGIQEEAPSLGKPVLVLRENTERPEGIDAGTARLVGSSQSRIYDEAKKLILSADEYAAMSKAVNPYGDGTSSEKIFKLVKSFL